jgi:hypothetical protein
MKKSKKKWRFDSGKWFWLSIIEQLVVGVGTRPAAMLCTCRKECKNTISLLISVSGWPIIMIGPGGLLAISSYLLSKVSV